VDPGIFAKDIKEPAWAISLAATSSPTIVVKFGAIVIILVRRYSVRVCLYSDKNII